MPSKRSPAYLRGSVFRSDDKEVPAKRHFRPAAPWKRRWSLSVPETYGRETALSLRDGQRSLSMSHHGQERAGLV
jgi:hypothetical protein